ncbi:unnamed protein product [Acanthoscelides obtectus]|uniref:Major facilitator superfamily (MFS) profile domain-containing protein n=1 Tax=Acanthoscelides obtectus TaxID=200917 RepID=A0A9P0KCI9_ACAOB|nr:unnamed protein product [Acanthoscelides obtectus]CAK1662538.1 Facilitated trehalose transporter Tret1 [Acanthoscelides obtectus]
MRDIIHKVFPAKKNGGVLTQYLAVVSASISIFTAGINYGWPLPSLKRIMSDEFPLEVTEEDASYVTIANNVGNLIGGVLATFLIDRVGRKHSSMVYGVLLVVSLVMIYLSWLHMGLLYAARIIGGIGEGGPFVIMVTYSAELASPQIRGTLCSLLTIAYIAGSLFINIVGSYFDIHTTALICLVFPLIFIVTIACMPDTPYYYLMKKDDDAAVRSLKFFRMKEDVEKEIEELRVAVARQMSEKGRLVDLILIDSNRKALILTTFARIFQQWSGASAFGQFYQTMLEQSTDMSPVLGSSVIIIVQILAVVLSTSFVDKLGRKPIIVVSYGINCIILVALATFMIIRDETAIDTSSYAWLPLPLLTAFTASFWGGVGNVLGFLINEMYSTSIKPVALAVASIVYAVSVMTVTKFFHFTMYQFGMAIPLYTFAFCSLVGIFYYQFLLIETKGKTLEEIQLELKGINKYRKNSA